jgi:hypothetical protein
VPPFLLFPLSIKELMVSFKELVSQIHDLGHFFALVMV